MRRSQSRTFTPYSFYFCYREIKKRLPLFNYLYNGLREKIWLFQGQILDGRNRYQACLEVETSPEFREYQGSESDALNAVLSWNLNRRNLTSGQRAAIAGESEELLNELAQQAKERQGTRNDLKPNFVQKIEQSSTEIPILELKESDPMATRTVSKIAAALGTNRQYVSDAKKLKETAPEIHAEVKAGTLSIPQLLGEYVEIPYS